ncbi:MAG TPA: ATPase, partial [Gallionellaceae bacterium]|nr:ATPase [Gallionellaceae bacterium]
LELNAFIENLDRMPDLDAIMRGEQVPVPREVDLQYAVAAALVGRAIRAKDTPEAKEQHGYILDYANAFPLREMGIMLVSDMHRAIGQRLFAVPQFANWANAVADLMLYHA